MFRAKLSRGTIDFATPAAALKFQEWKNANDGRWITIDIEKQERTLSELRMYRAWLSNVADHTGNDEDELHEFLIEKCAPTVVMKIKGRKGSVEVERKKRTSGGTSLTMDKAEMAEFMQKAALLTGYPLPTEEELAAMGYAPNSKAPVQTATPIRKVEYPKEENNLADIL